MNEHRLELMVADIEALKASVTKTIEFQAELKGIIRIIQWIGAGFMSFMTLFCLAAGGVIWSSMITLEGIKTQLPLIKPTVTDADLKLVSKDVQELEIRVTALQSEVNKGHK